MLAYGLRREGVALAECVDACRHELATDEYDAGSALLGDLAVGARIDCDDELMQVIFRIHPELFAELAGSLQVLRLQVGELLEGLTDLGRAEGRDVEADDGDGTGGQAVGVQRGLGRGEGEGQDQGGEEEAHDGRALSPRGRRGQADSLFF